MKKLNSLNIDNFNLIEQLENYKPSNKDETKYILETLKFLDSEGNNFSRDNLNGHINGSAYLFNADLNKVLLMHHKILNDWFQFGGHSDGESNTLKVAIRETTEESGINNFELIKKSIFDISVNRIPNNEKKHEPAHLHYDVYFAFITNEDKFIQSNESNELRWFTMEEYEKLPTNEQRKRFINKWKVLQKMNNINSDQKF